MTTPSPRPEHDAPAVPTVRRGDLRYPGLTRGQNQRWVSRPDHVHLPTTTGEVVAAVGHAVRNGSRLTVRSGGHCYEEFVDRPDVDVIVDMTQMNAVTYDEDREAFMVEAGASLGDVYDTLLKRWGVTLPGGSCYPVCAGGHVPGGGYGALSREHGLISDHLHGVEVVVVDGDGTARPVVATREEDDPNRELWWAHTGGGGGNFGVVTRYWFRSPRAESGCTPDAALPAPPASVWIHRSEWSWDDMTRERFGALLRNYGSWLEENSFPESPYTGLFARLELAPQPVGSFHLVVQMDADRPDAERLLDDFRAAVNEGVGVEPTVTEHRKLPWLHAAGWRGMWFSSPTERYKYKSSYHRRGFTESQIDAFYTRLTDTEYDQPPFAVSIASFGGRVNALEPADTANPHRDSVMLLLWGTTWNDPAEDDTHLRWHQEFYRAVYADTGGVPVPNRDTDGCFVNYCDIDLNDPELNTSGVPWYRLYYKENYRRLQEAKGTWDPGDVFHHGQSVALP
ncbi:FAD/FMN-containing dehydrogenase [Haloactinospora alba]|uniref:FAD/FMN-containing dehydrogenase n=1 Tax=Haloactinospora alba TaxID=405555 RepID=A0A543N8Y2_9ACTN|nr:FAD-binding protein [Haloactinospora alba]TQN28287.1 FAD/FMN-containing dehydrogenase [Haloactinospora alba]